MSLRGPPDLCEKAGVDRHAVQESLAFSNQKRYTCRAQTTIGQSQVRRFSHVLGVILLGPGEVFVLVIITAVVVLLAVRGRNVK